MHKSARVQISLAALLGFTAVLSGALGAHALEETLMDRGTAGAWDTAVLYHFGHGLALFALGSWNARDGASASRSWAAGLWTAGTILFSGSLYLLALGGPSFLGPLTPLGGLLFLAGWLMILRAAWVRQ